VRCRFDTIVFDFDGVLVESVNIKTQAFVELYRPYGKEVATEVAAYHLAHGGVSRCQKFRHFHSILLGKTLSKEEEERLATEFSKLVEDAVVAAPWVAGARDFVARHYRRIPLHIASATPTEELLRIVNRRGMRSFFREVVGAPQSKGAILNHIILAGGYVPERVLMVGDALTDFDGAQETGVAFLGRVGRDSRSPFSACIQTIEDLGQLAACLDA
jgi:phosphoglycolate phosphatase-like HAD superfamily hydrolase